MSNIDTTDPQAPRPKPARASTLMSDDGRYRMLVEGVRDYAIYMLSPTGTISSWNLGAQRFKGYDADEIIGRHFSEFYTPEDRARNLPAVALQTAATKGKYESEGWRVRKNGERFWAYVVIDPIFTPDGELFGFAKITRDLTERRAAEESLRASQEQFRLLVQGVTDYAIYMLSPKGDISSWNLGAQRIKGFAAEEVIGTHFSRFYTPEDRAAGEPMRALATAEREGRFEKEGIRVRKDGTAFWANIVIDAVRGDDGKLIGFAKVTRDITAQIEARRALEVARESLFHAQKMDAIGQLTGGVAHDFNNLLTAIMGNLELLRKRLPDDPRALSLLDNAVLGAQRGAALTQRMLAFARRQDLEVEAIDIPALVRGMSDLLDRSVGPGVTMELRFPLKLVPALTDANQLELALLNLVVNARDAMPDGGAIIVAAKEVEVEDPPPHGVRPGRYVCLSVQDTGEGMDEQTLAKATEPFFTTKDIGKGTGLGLAMVHGVAEQSGGRLVLISRRGVGTTAEIWLPVANQPLPAKDDGTQQPERASRPLVVLAVDDDSLVLGSTVAMLEDLGHEVMHAASAEEALALMRDRRIDMMITDHAMPDTTGAQLIEAARAQRPELPIVLATGFAELPAGIGDALVKLPKPFTQQELARAVSDAMEGKCGVSSSAWRGSSPRG